jgi:hypothetical protein
MGRCLYPKKDLLFKRVFGEHAELLKSFLNAPMPFDKEQYIENPEYLPAELVSDSPAKRNSIELCEEGAFTEEKPATNIKLT